MKSHNAHFLRHLLHTAVLVWGACVAQGAMGADGCANQSAVMALPQPDAPAIGGGVGGTGQQAGRPGLGGTGIDGGVGGTGIVGVITGFASVCVNGVEVHFDANTPVSEDGKPVPQNTLAVGKLVSIQAAEAGQAYSARSIAVMNAVVGPVDRVNTRWGELQVLGQTVLAPSPAAVAAIKPGQWVQVGGYRQATGEIQASFVGVVPAQSHAQLTGVFEHNMGVDVVVSGTDVRLTDTKLPSEVGRGSEVTVTGDWDGNTLRARDIVVEPTQRSLGAARTVLVEGLVRSVGGQSIQLGPQRLYLRADSQVQGGRWQDLAVNQRVRVFGHIGDSRRMEITRIEIREGNKRTHSANGMDRTIRRAGDDDASGDDRGADSRTGDDRSGKSDAGGGRTSAESESGSRSSDPSGRTSGSGTSGSTSGSSGSGKSGSSGGSGSTSGSSGSSGSGKSSGK